MNVGHVWWSELLWESAITGGDFCKTNKRQSVIMVLVSESLSWSLGWAEPPLLWGKINSLAALSVGSWTCVCVAESFLIYSAALLLLEAVPVAGTGLGRESCPPPGPAVGVLCRTGEESAGIDTREVLERWSCISEQPTEVRGCRHLQAGLAGVFVPYCIWHCRLDKEVSLVIRF